MKKLYLFLCTIVCMAFAAKADNNFKFDVTIENPDEVSVVFREYSYMGAGEIIEELEVKEGLNQYEFTMTTSDYVYFSIEPKEGYVLKIHETETGNQNSDVKDNVWSLYLSGSPYYFYPTEYALTVKTFDEATFRNRSVKVTLDNPDGIRMELKGNSAFNADKTEYEISYNEIYEDVLTIRKNDTEELIYKVTADGEEIVKNNYSYIIPLVDRSDEEDIKYTNEIVITQDFPADATANIKIIFTNGDPNCIKSITYNNEPVSDYAAEDGFNVYPGKKLYIEFNTDEYRMISYQKNDNEPNESSYISIVSESIGSDFTLTVTAEKYQDLTAYLTVDNPENVRVTKGSYPNVVEYDIVAGENEISFTDKSWANELKVEPRDGYEITRIYDATNDKEITLSTWSTYTTIYLEADAHYEVYTTKIYRDKQIIFYVDDLTGIVDQVTFSRGGHILYATEGYNTIDFRDKDGLISVSAYNAPTEAKYYRNDELMDITYMSYFSIKDPQDKEVVKMFLMPENAVEHTVTFEMNENALEGYEVTKDIVTPVFTEFPVAAVGKTLFTIAPVTRAADDDLTITVGETTMEPVDGVYSFETEADTTVKVSRATSGIENVINGENETADVYNLQGIRVARQANAAAVNALPAGIYIVNGQKVAVK